MITGHLFNPSVDLPDETTVETVQFPTRIYNALSRADRTLGEIREPSDEMLASFPDLGRGSVK